jgi:hypothetical protein
MVTDEQAWGRQLWHPQARFLVTLVTGAPLLVFRVSRSLGRGIVAA